MRVRRRRNTWRLNFMTDRAISRQLPLAIVIASGAAGMFGRLSGFGERPLAVDEYYFWKSVELVLADGVPRLPDGGYYVQGLAPQYLAALSVLVFGKSETVFRLPALLAGLVVPFLAYRYARGHVSRPLALTVAAALFLSSWEIEFSRFARMYTPLQCAALAFLIRMDRSLLGPEWNRRYLAHFWVVGAVLCHFEGALLAPLLYAPFLDWNNPDRFPNRRSRLEYFTVTSLVTAAVSWFALFDFRRWGASNLFPDGYAPPDWSAIRAPAFFLWRLQNDPRWNLAFVVAVLLAVVLWWLLFSRPRSFPKLAAPLVAVAAGLHQAMLAALLFGLLLVRSGWGSLSRRQRALIALSAVVLSGWIAAAIARGTSLRAFYRTFLGWPNLIEPLWRTWGQDLPLVGLLALAATAVLFTAKVRAPWIDLARGPAAVVAYWLLCLGLVRYVYASTRYSFFLYPAVLTAVALAIARLIGPRWAAAVFLGAFCLGGDFDPTHIARAGTEEVAFRLDRYAPRARLWYPRHDYRGVAQRLESAARRGEAIVVEHCAPVSHYLQGEHAIFLDRRSYGFYERSRRNGTVELWSRQPLLSTAEELRAHTRDKLAVWLVREAPSGAPLFDPRDVWGARLKNVERKYLSRDGGIETLYISLRDAGASDE